MQVAGIEYDVPWHKFSRGSSLFFPCLDPEAAQKEMRVVLKRLKIKVVAKTTIVEGIKGVRIWRV